MMNSFFTALSFLSVLPLPGRAAARKPLPAAVFWFPVAGLILGAILAAANVILSALNLNQPAAAAVIIVLLTMLTGGLHTDGLADTFDAFFSGKSKDEMLVIMRDPHIGSIGVIAITSTLLLKVVFLGSVAPAQTANALLLACMLGRWAMVTVMFLFPYARTDGKPKAFMDGLRKRTVIAATALSAAIAFALSGLTAVALMCVAGITAYAFASIARKKIGGITGDCLGAINEITEVTVLSVFTIIN